MTRFVGFARATRRAALVFSLPSIATVAGAQSPAAGTGRSYTSPPRSSALVNSVGAPVTITIEGGARRMIVGATVPHTARLRDASGAERRDVPVQWTSSDPNVASVNQFGVLTAVRPGAVTVRAIAGSLSAERKYSVEANPVKSLTLSITADQVRTGDVVEVSAMAFDASGYKVPNVPFLYTFTSAVEDSAVGQLAPAELDQKGRFVAQKAGDYQIIAIAPGLVAHRTIRVSNRDMAEGARVLSKATMPGGQVADVFAWHARDGRDYVLSCSAGTRAQLVSYEVSDAGLKAIDTASVDAKGGVTDCSVDSESGLSAVVRDAGNGRSTIALIDANDPHALKSLGVVDDGLGAVAGVAIYKRYLFAVSDSRRLDVFSIEDPAKPRRAGSIDLGAGSSVGGAATDVSINDGIAYVALGRLGMAMVDIGNGKFGGSPTKPARIAGFHAPFSSTHAAYGYRSRTGKWYAILSEDIGASADAAQSAPSSGQPGFARIVDFTDPAHPEEVARYEVPEAGVQDLWVDNERLYVAAQNGGVRVVDISADLKGNLYHQGREIARSVSVDGSTPNVVAVQPVRGGVVAADRANGVLMLKLGTKE